jgi:hypothetical protein
LSASGRDGILDDDLDIDPVERGAAHSPCTRRRSVLDEPAMSDLGSALPATARNGGAPVDDRVVTDEGRVVAPDREDAVKLGPGGKRHVLVCPE